LPLYEFECPKCGRFEVIRKFSDRPLKKCPTCGRAIEKMLSAPAIQFKGAGWYVTDYARKSAGSEGAAKASGESAKADAAKPDTAATGAATTDTASKPAKKDKAGKAAKSG
jgi:putative FmdB family regulatory protein